MTQQTENSAQWQVASGKRLRLCVGLLLVTCHWSLVTSAFGATKVFLHNTSSKLGDANGVISSEFKSWLADASQGASLQTMTISSIAGKVTGQYWPSSTTGHILTQSAGGSKIIWVSAPLSSGVTISGTITPNLWGKESAAQCNCGARYEILRWDFNSRGIASSLGISSDDGLSEWGTSAAVRTTPTLTPTSTTFNTNDRLVIVIYNDDGSGVTEASGRNWTLDFNGATGVDGDTYLSFTETVSFSADTNTARPIPTLSLLPNAIDPLWAVWSTWWGEGRRSNS